MTDRAQVEPVLIVGAGPVGLASALLLARWDVPSVILEAEPERTQAGSRAICFQRDVLDILGRIGCAEDMIAEGVTWTTGRTYYRDTELFTVRFPGIAYPPPWINISQTRVEHLLLAQVARRPLIDLRPGHQMVGLTVDADSVAVSTATGATIRGSYLVGADGPHSAVRKLLGIDFPGRSFDDQFLICDIRADLPFPSERRFFFDPEWNPGRQVLVHQCPDRVWRIDWQVPAGFDLEAERASGALDARIRQITADAPYEVVWATAYRFHERVAARFCAGRTFLAGDAAHLFAPFGARGLNSGLQDAENLAWKVAFAAHGWAGPGLLPSYHAERYGAALENLAVTSATMEFLVPQTDEQRRRRTQTLERALTDPAARSQINSGKLAEPYWYTDSPLTTPGPGPVAPGMLCPDAPCRAPDGSPTRLRRLIGGGFVVLGCAQARADSGVPVTSYLFADVDPHGDVGAALNATASSVHVIRPDGHLAAVLDGPDPRELATTLRRALGYR
jgi:2-polyprenyl-6-methoxyphenol hydroxylase-like FAD-dependent oxidoreductase